MKNFCTQDIDLAAAIMAATGVEAQMHQETEGALVNFEFPNTQATKDTILKFASGQLTLDVRRFANRRAWLYREVSAMRKGALR